jgi:hypothetical protein
MSRNENVHRMRAQILNLRSAAIACATAIQYFPPCGRPESCNGQCPEARSALKAIYESMNHLMLSVRIGLTVVFQRDPEDWDFLWELTQQSTCVERALAEVGQSAYPDQDEHIRIWSEIDDETMDRLGSTFSDAEWDVLTARGAWQNGQRLPQILYLLHHLEDQIEKQFDLFDSVLYSGILGDCKLGQWVEKDRTAIA